MASLAAASGFQRRRRLRLLPGQACPTSGEFRCRVTEGSATGRFDLFTALQLLEAIEHSDNVQVLVDPWHLVIQSRMPSISNGARTAAPATTPVLKVMREKQNFACTKTAFTAWEWSIPWWDTFATSAGFPLALFNGLGDLTRLLVTQTNAALPVPHHDQAAKENDDL